MIEPWRTYEEIQPVSATGISLVDAFGEMVLERWDIHSTELREALQAEASEGELPAIAAILQCALILQEAAVHGRLTTFARPLNGGLPVTLDPVHWEIDDPLPRISTGLMNLSDWTNPRSEPTHRIFVNRNDFRDLMGWFITDDEKSAVPTTPKAAAAQRKALVEPPHTRQETSSASYADAALPVGIPPLREDKILRRREVIAMCGISRSTIDNYMKAGTFPNSVDLGPNAVGWYHSDIATWMEARRQ